MIVGVGCDIVAIERLAEKKSLAKRILTKKEYEVYEQLSGQRQNEYFAGRFAAKEAVFKAMNQKDVTISKIEILSDETGKPVCFMEGYTLHVSIAHEKEYATAYVLCEK